MFIQRISMRYAASALGLTLVLAAPLSAQHEDHQVAPAATTAVEITGTVFCSDGPPLPGAVVQLFSGRGDQERVYASALTDTNGRFRIRGQTGMSRLSIRYLGHVDLSRDINLEAGARTLNLGSIALDISALELEAIVAAAEQDRVQLKAGATVFDVEKSGARAGGSVADVMRNVPSLDVNADGQVNIRGSSKVLVLINGRRVALEGAALAAFLRQLPASTLAKIEVSTTGDARADADGAGGVVNLVLDMAQLDARSTSYSLSASAATGGRYMGSVAGAGSTLGITWDASYAFSALQPETRSLTTRENFLAPDALRTSDQVSAAQADHRLHSITLGLRGQLAAEHVLGAALGYSWMRGAYDNRTDFSDVSAAGIRTSDATTISTLEHTIPSLDAALSWSWQNEGPARMRMSSEIRGTDGMERFWGNYHNELGERFLATEMDYRQRELSIANDASFDWRGGRIEIGQKSRWRALRADYLSARTTRQEDHAFAHDQDVHAVYASGARVFDNVFVQAGARVEQDITNGVRSTGLFPSVKLHWPHEVEGVLQYSLAYGRRIDRPDAASLNPYSMGEDDMNEVIGNPDLAAEVTDQLEFSVVRQDAILTLQATPFLRQARNPIRAVKAVTASGRATTTLHNLERARSAGLDLGIKWRISDRVNTMLAPTLFYMATDGELESHGWYANLRANLDVQLGESTTAQLYAFRRSAEVIEQGRIYPDFTSDVALVHQFGADRRGALTLRVSDVFNTSKLAFHVADATFVQHSERKVSSRMAALFVSWAVGGERQDAPTAPETTRRPRIF